MTDFPKINCQLAKVYKNNFKIQYLSLRNHYTLSKCFCLTLPLNFDSKSFPKTLKVLYYMSQNRMDSREFPGQAKADIFYMST